MSRGPSGEKEYLAPVGEGIYSVATGDWRTQYPQIKLELCRSCGNCLMYCPVNAVRREAGPKKGGTYRIDLAFCKGCGICAHECPQEAIEMRKEGPR